MMRFGKKAAAMLAITAIASSYCVAENTHIADQRVANSQTSISKNSVSQGSIRSASVEKLPNASAEKLPALPDPSRRSISGPAPDLRGAVVLNTRNFGIPFNVDASNSQPVEVRLFMSDGGTSPWKLIDRKPPTVKEFQFKGTRDGVVWFATRTIDRSGTASPSDPLKPQLRVFIDTAKPSVKLDADASAEGAISAVLDFNDTTPIKSVQVHYATDVLREWISLDTKRLPENGRIGFTPKQNWQQLSLQAIVVDSAGNQTTVSRLLQRPRVAKGKPSNLASTQTPNADTKSAAMRLDDKDKSKLPVKLASGPTNVPQRVSINEAEFKPPTQKKPSAGNAQKNPSAEDAQEKPSARIAQTLPLKGRPPQLSNAAASKQPQINTAFDLPEQLPSKIDPRVNDPRSIVGELRTNRFASSPAVAARPNIAAQTSKATSPPSAAKQSKSQFVLPGATSQNALPDRAATPKIAARPQTNASSPTAQNPIAQNPLAPDVGFTPDSLPLGFAPPSIAPATPNSATAVNQLGGLNTPRIGSGINSQPPQGAQGMTLPNLGPATQLGPSSSATPTPSTSGPKSGPETTAAAKPKRRPPRTAAEAMRPISKTKPQSSSNQMNSSYGTANRAAPATEAESVLARDTESPEYRAMRRSQEEYDRALLVGKAPMRFSDSLRFSLEYELEAVGAGGVEAVELYGSTDGGRSWERWGIDPDLKSPFDIETKDEGVFAFKIVVVSRNGLASPRPLPQDAPDIVVVVDKSKPGVKINAATYGEGNRAGTLVIRYGVEDHNLTQRPISLAFSDSVKGPWTTIAAGLVNEGEYIWPGDPELPRELFLRIDAKDRAGNIGTYILDKPIDARGLAPRARIRGFRSLGDNGYSSPEGQTATLPEGTFK